MSVAQRYFTVVLARLLGAVGAVFGVVLIGRAHTLGPKLLGLAIIASALWAMATVPRSLAHRWRSPPSE